MFLSVPVLPLLMLCKSFNLNIFLYADSDFYPRLSLICDFIITNKI